MEQKVGLYPLGKIKSNDNSLNSFGGANQKVLVGLKKPKFSDNSLQSTAGQTSISPTFDLLGGYPNLTMIRNVGKIGHILKKWTLLELILVHA